MFNYFLNYSNIILTKCFNKSTFSKIFFWFSFIVCLSVNAQNSTNYIVLINKDSIFCNDLVYETSLNGRLTYLSYKTKEGKTVEYNNRFKVPKLDCFYYGKEVYELVPRRSYLQKKRKIVAKREVDGKITFCYYNNEKMYTRTYTANTIGSGTSKTGFRLRYVRLGNNKYIKLNKINMMFKIKPYLKSCEMFVKEYNGKYKVGYFATNVVGMFELYNHLCSQGSGELLLKP